MLTDIYENDDNYEKANYKKRLVPVSDSNENCNESKSINQKKYSLGTISISFKEPDNDGTLKGPVMSEHDSFQERQFNGVIKIQETCDSRRPQYSYASKEEAAALKNDSMDVNMLPENTFRITSQLLAIKLDCNIGIMCSVCNESNFIGYRYKCCFCLNYDMCSECFEIRKVSGYHLSSHPMFFIKNPLTPKDSDYLSTLFSLGPETLSIMFDESVHKDVRCQVCDSKPIKGIRVKCDDCAGYNLCWSCYSRKMVSRSHTADHSVVAHLVPLRDKFDPKRDIRYLNDNKKSKGSFGSVQKVYYKDKLSALKVITLNGEERDDVLWGTFCNEMFAYGEIHSNHILKFYGQAVENYDDCTKLYLLMEFMEKGSIKDAIKNKESISLRRKLQWILDIIKGIRRIHSKGFVHKDIKPDNILVNSKDTVKIGDMGIAIHDQGKGYFKEKTAPLTYAAPEVLSGKFNNKVDIFSYGLVVYEIFTYKTRILDSTENLLPFFSNLFKPVRFSENSQVFMPLIVKCVSPDPEERPPAFVIEQKLNEFDEEFWSSLPIRKTDYVTLTVEEKDKIFLEFYNHYAEDRLTFNDKYTL